MNSGEQSDFDAKATLDADIFMDYEMQTTHPRYIPAVLEQIDRPGLKFLDVGGASGVFLQQIMTLADQPIEATNLEYMGEYANRQVSDQIEFIEGSILESGLPDAAYDIVTFRHILHHLVADTLEATQANQKLALSEMLRIVKPGGCLVFEEELNLHRQFSRVIYELSKLGHRSRLKSDLFKGAGTVVVSFLSPRELATMLDDLGRTRDLEIVKDDYHKWDMPLRWKLTVLMSRVGSTVYVIRVNK